MSAYDFSTWDRNCDKECPEAIDGTVTGTIPAWLRGSLISNGPGLMKYGDKEFNHVFDGSAILQKFTFTETGVKYTSKFLRSYAYCCNSEHKQVVVSEFGTKGTSTSKGVFQKFGEKFQFDKMFSDNAPVTLAQYGGDWYATTEAPFLHKIDINSLETIEKVDLHKLLSVNSQCPHPVTMPDGSTINVFNGVGAMGPRYDILRFPASPAPGEKNVFTKPKRIGTCDTRWKLSPCHMHTFGMTERYLVLPEQPMTVDVTAMVANTIRDKPLIDGMEWISDKQVKFKIVSLDTGKELKLKLKADTFFYMHIINCFEQDNHLVIDLSTYEKPSLLYSLLVDNIRKKGLSLASEVDEGSMKRFVIPLQHDEKAPLQQNLVTLEGATATASRQKDGSLYLTPQVLCTVAYENAVVSPRSMGKAYTFCYGASAKMSGTTGAVGKLNVKTCELKESPVDADTYVSTHSFIPRPGGQAEDDGVVLAQCLHAKDRRLSLLQVLDASTMEELATVSFTLPSDAPRTLHSVYFDGA